jgi:hypothetical protein
MKKARQILITGGLHGDESSGIAIASHFLNKSGNVHGLICNIEAVKQGKRLIETDMNDSFGKYIPMSLEEIAAEKIVTTIRKFNLIIDIHNTRADGTTCAIVVRKPNKKHLFLAKYFGFNKIVIMPRGRSLIGLKPRNAISLEIAHNAMKNFSNRYLIDKILGLRNITGKYEKSNLKIFVFVNEVLPSTLNRLSLSKNSFFNFKKLSRTQELKFGLKSSSCYYPIFVNTKEDEKIAFTLVKQIDVK